MEDLESFIANQNIARFLDLVAAEPSPEKRANLERLLAEALNRIALARLRPA